MGRCIEVVSANNQSLGEGEVAAACETAWQKSQNIFAPTDQPAGKFAGSGKRMFK
jgi:hypothetical protein